MRPVGWRYESSRHSLAAKGMKTRYFSKLSDEEQFLSFERRKNLERLQNIKNEYDSLETESRMLRETLERRWRQTGVGPSEEEEKRQKELLMKLFLLGKDTRRLKGEVEDHKYYSKRRYMQAEVAAVGLAAEGGAGAAGAAASGIGTTLSGVMEYLQQRRQEKLQKEQLKLEKEKIEAAEDIAAEQHNLELEKVRADLEAKAALVEADCTQRKVRT